MAYGGGAGVGCLTAARFTMSALILHQETNFSDPSDELDPDFNKYGEWVRSQDPLTGAVIRVWKPTDDIVIPNDPATVDIDEHATLGQFPCIARGIVDGGIRVAGTTERFGDTYENIDYVKLWMPASVRITKRDRITNIRDASGHIRWLDEEYADRGQTPKATVFNVNGVTPLFNAFNVMTEQFALLERVE